MGNELTDEVRARRERTAQALRDTQFASFEACVVEWLMSDVSPDYAELRTRLSGGASNFTIAQLDEFRELIRDLVSALAKNTSMGDP